MLIVRRICPENGVRKLVTEIVMDCSVAADASTPDNTMLRESVAWTVQLPTVIPGVSEVHTGALKLLNVA